MDSFYKNATKADGRSDECRSCRQEMVREYYRRDLERSRARSRQSAAVQRDHNRERALTQAA